MFLYVATVPIWVLVHCKSQQISSLTEDLPDIFEKLMETS